MLMLFFRITDTCRTGYQTAGDFYFELFDDRFQPGSEDSILFIFFPVKQR